MKKFFNYTALKNVILGVMVISIGGICSALGSWDVNNDRYFWVKFVVLLILMASYIILLAYYATKEVNNSKTVRVLEYQKKAYEEAMIGIISICKSSAQDINKIIHEIIEDGRINLRIWSFDIACELVCEKIYNLLCNLHGESKDFGICYIRLDETKNTEKTVYMNAFCNQNMSAPSVYRKRRKIKDKDYYHDIELFRRNKSDFDIIIGKENVQQLFSFTSNESRQRNKNKYNQYVAIPVICSKDDGGKMVGLLEIVCFNETEIAKTKEEIKEVASKYFIPYVFLLLLLHKLEKAVLAQPNLNKGKTDGEKNK